ncbi:Putative Zinc finger C2H2-type [Colletotrichum destructivum]|uniref:Zinc finger C2H2-type n=1 Tax=Colletotrichum destructivum TaxID=34406 RepID=A0AAX4HYN4_9PEZI|nr:Putative Zinc finger C2H2-type [Colletotrichum destructivum]
MDSIQCHVCSLPFPTQQQLQQHIWHYQTEIATLLAKLHELFAHQSTELDTIKSSDTRAPLLPIVNTNNLESDIDTLPPLPMTQTADEAESPQHRGATDESNPSDPQKAFACPECEATVARKQDLERHYTIHYRCKEFCQFCSNTFTSARKSSGDQAWF